MHTYTANSPEAISRILALAMIVDGHLSPSELHAMQRATFLEQVKVDDDTFDRTLRELCEDLLDAAANRRAGMVEIDPVLLDGLLQDIRDPLLQICLWKTMVDIVQADGHLDGRETTLVRRAARAWFGQDRAEDAFTTAALAS
ncbi:TerB family tellurite resistance protein [Massilia sp. G4R7]|uniref:TerB family tellurite resistance protein n=1 Tax=Massilia phyllostachyos TaxID=2898585 RepID=A0ABS8Q6C7_9BURK|nr:TerB family tellurite resistance protein [Massilia phyllostachyos]MCD2517300.1 TerB family tellurite resistance protein [Massilia phyllostachyos]